MSNLLISPEQFIEQKKTALKWQIFGIDFFIKATTKRHKIQILPEHERPSISKKCVIYRPNLYHLMTSKNNL